MRKLKRPGIGVVVLIGLLVGSGAAWAGEVAAEPEETDAEQTANTLFNFGYDIINRVLAWNLTALDWLYDCSLENGPLTATYGEATDEGVIPVSNLQDGAGVVSFPDRPEEELAEGLEPAGAPVAYSGADGECGLSGGEVSGPEGQVNHGMFMRLFNSLYDGAGRGCVVRYLAQSDLGKGEQQVKAGEDPDFESVLADDTGVIDFTSVEADCEQADQATDNGEDVNDEGNGRPDHAGGPDSPGKPDHAGEPDSPGKSGSAPGHNN